jgi:cytochrome c oxidase cbb3-type subunit 3
MKDDKQKRAVQTTGHAWDGDIQEFNNPLPNWWLWGFYLTVVFAVIYWFLYPAWPIGESYTKGIGNDIEYKTADGKVVKTHWNTRALYQKELEEARAVQAKYVAQLEGKSFQEILNDPDKRGYAMSVAKVLFADNCAACHQEGGAGLIGAYPNLIDDDWLWGGKFEQIEQTIRAGRNGMMPSFKQKLTEAQLDDTAEYVLSMSGQHQDVEKVKRGEMIFNGDGGCFACHTKEGTGNIAMGSANLTDHIWTVAKVDNKQSYSEKHAAVKKVIQSGITRTMPAWQARFSDTEMKMLALYVHELGGGK